MSFRLSGTLNRSSLFAISGSGSGSRGSPPVKFFPPPGRISLRGYDFACLEEGSGEPLLFVHGSLGTYLDFADAVRHFSQRYRAISYSRRFHPPNAVESPGAEYSMARHADDLAALLSRLLIDSAHIVGSSWGAYVALFLAAHRPALVRTLVLGEPPVFPLLGRSQAGTDLLEMFRRKTIQPTLAALRHGNKRDGVRAFVDGVTGRSGNFDRLPRDARQMLLLSAEELGKEFEMPPGAYMPELTVESLNAIPCPVLLLEGERSPKLFHLITDELEHDVPRTQRAVISGAGHVMHTGNPGAYFHAVGDFLRRHERERRPSRSR